MGRRRYSDEERAAALAELEANGGNVTWTARELGVPESTLRRWRDDPNMAAPAELRAQKKESLADMWEKVARQALAFLGRAFDDYDRHELERELPLQDVKLTMAPKLATVAGIATEKHQLLTGGPTERHEYREVPITEVEVPLPERRNGHE